MAQAAPDVAAEEPQTEPATQPATPAAAMVEQAIATPDASNENTFHPTRRQAFSPLSLVNWLCCAAGPAIAGLGVYLLLYAPGLNYQGRWLIFAGAVVLAGGSAIKDYVTPQGAALRVALILMTMAGLSLYAALRNDNDTEIVWLYVAMACLIADSVALAATDTELQGVGIIFSCGFAVLGPAYGLFAPTTNMLNGEVSLPVFIGSVINISFNIGGLAACLDNGSMTNSAPRQTVVAHSRFGTPQSRGYDKITE